ncbi:MAG: dihydrodipicolinate synthase family protein [Armatimonadetes bacterium]|nr:dihydrodipicolinate synthase family protein [Armatimonadota bacterium]
MVLEPGVYPASVTPMTDDDKVDEASLARLLAKFESEGCKGVVLAGTNGEGPSLSAVEKRDLVRTGVACKGKLKVILGIATPSLDEARWLASQAGKAGADALLVMPPAYYRWASTEAIVAWFTQLADASPIPILAYNFPGATGMPFSAETMGKLLAHSQIAGLKDSSGQPENIASYRAVAGPEKVLFVGDETLLVPALEAGWTGTISGAANTVAPWLVRIINEPENRKTLEELVMPVLKAIRGAPQPPTNKALLHAFGAIASAQPRLPLESIDPSTVMTLLSERLGLRPA